MPTRQTTRLVASTSDRPPEHVVLWLARREPFVQWLQAVPAVDWQQERALYDARSEANQSRAQAWLHGRLMWRAMLAKHFQREADSFVFAYGTLGAPCLKKDLADQVRLSLAHTEDVTLASFSELGRLGVDVEWADRFDTEPNRALQLARRYAPLCASALALLPARIQAKTFLALWTLLEAWAKAFGGGISVSLAGHASLWDSHLASQVQRIAEVSQVERKTWFWLPSPRISGHPEMCWGLRLWGSSQSRSCWLALATTHPSVRAQVTVSIAQPDQACRGGMAHEVASSENIYP